jgi:hypothetical protein
MSDSRTLLANFHEEALFVKTDVAVPLVVELDGASSFALCFHPL